jgi:hypothetical protein
MSVGFRTYVDPEAVERVTLTCVTTLRGGGVAGDPVRRVRLYYDDAGALVGEYDPITRDPVVLKEWFRARGWGLDLGQQGSDDPWKEIVFR